MSLTARTSRHPDRPVQDGSPPARHDAQQTRLQTWNDWNDLERLTLFYRSNFRQRKVNDEFGTIGTIKAFFLK